MTINDVFLLTDEYLLPYVSNVWPQHPFWGGSAVLQKKKKKSFQLVVWSQLKLIVFYAPVSKVSASEPEARH